MLDISLVSLDSVFRSGSNIHFGPLIIITANTPEDITKDGNETSNMFRGNVRLSYGEWSAKKPIQISA